MAILEKKDVNPIVVAIGNFCCLFIVGYILLGQVAKGVFVLLGGVITCVAVGIISTIISTVTFGIGAFVMIPAGMAIMIAYTVIAALDAYKIAEAMQSGQEVDENEYKIEILYKMISIIHKDAVFKSNSNNNTATNSEVDSKTEANKPE